MRGSSCLLLLLASFGMVVLAVPPNHSPYYRPSNRNFRPSPQFDPETQGSTFLPPPTPSAHSTPRVTLPQQPFVVSAPQIPKLARPPPANVDLTPTNAKSTPLKKSGNAAVDRLRQLLDVDRMAQGSQVHEDKVEAAAAGHIPLVHALPQLTLLLQLLLHLLQQVVPAPHHYHHSGALLNPHIGHGGHLGHSGHLNHGGHHKGPFHGPGLYGVSASNVLGRGPFPAYKYEDNAKK
ncbi:Hypothetical predicted protein [Cloeon dipterum]|uniref:Uncharacterized protein n=1 Tax=Cloeon dipterum TaxID=197152 RepID=A0A8S1DIN2_9INSE|nr:Hypothetical predicted protein [Cloeon dipterum]